jgi:hypothetical protein
MSNQKREREEAKKKMRELVFASNREEKIARIINETYDPEMPINEVITAIFNTATAEPLEDVYYFLPTLPTKEVHLLTTNCNVTHAEVSPTSKQTLSWTSAVTKDYYICLNDLLEGDHNVLDLYGEDIIEELNRYEIYAVLQLIDAGAVARSNEFAPDSSDTNLTYAKAYEMKKAIRKYGRKLVLITGANVTEDVDLMDYNEDKNRPVSVMSIIDMHIPIESLDVTVGGVAKDVIDDDVAYLVAVSDSKKNKPGYFVRRRLGGALIASAPDTQVIAKERAVIATGNMKSLDTVDGFAKGIAGIEQFGAVLTNSYTCAKFDLNG